MVGRLLLCITRLLAQPVWVHMNWCDVTTMPSASVEIWSIQRVVDYQNHDHDLYCLGHVEGASVTWTPTVLVYPFSPG